MAIDEGARHRLFQRLEEVLGVEEAEVLMQHLPPLGWGDVATKHDLALLKNDLTLFRNEFKSDLARLEDRVMRQIAETSKRDLRAMVTTMITVNSVSVVAVAGLAFAAAKLS